MPTQGREGNQGTQGHPQAGGGASRYSRPAASGADRRAAEPVPAAAKTKAAPAAATSAAEQSVGKKVISDISGAQITASALAAVTSLFFSSNIGLAGSVIGVAASAAVTALSSSIYKSFIEGTKAKAKAKAAEAEAQDATGAPQTTQQFKREAFTNTEAAVSRDSGKYTHAAAKHSSKGVSGRFDVVNKKWFAIVLLTVVGLLTVFLTAHIITTATGGEGLGTKTTPIIQVHDDKEEAGISTDSQTESSGEPSESESTTTSESESTASQASEQNENENSSSASNAGNYNSGSSSSAGASSSSRVAASSSVASSSSSAQTASSSSAAAGSSSSAD